MDELVHELSRVWLIRVGVAWVGLSWVERGWVMLGSGWGVVYWCVVCPGAKVFICISDGTDNKNVPGGLRRGGLPPALAPRMPAIFEDA